MSKVTKDAEKIPIPTPCFGRRSNMPSLPWQELAIGESFLVHYEEDVDWLSEEAQKFANRISQTACQAGKRNSLRFVTRKLPEGIRMWRVR